MFVFGRKGVGRSSSYRKLSTNKDSDGNIRYYEYENDKFEYLSEYKSADPQRGIAFLPKRGLNVHENEVMRAFKTVSDNYIEPVSFVVPRRAEVFQGDIYPPVPGTKPAMSGSEWFAGKEGLPPKIDLESIYAGHEPTEVPSKYEPTNAAAPAASVLSSGKKEPILVKATSQPSPAIRVPPSMKEQTSSISKVASKFLDEDEMETLEDDDESSFEEIPKPIDRSEKQSYGPLKSEETAAPSMIAKGLDGTSGTPAAFAHSPVPQSPTNHQTLKVISSVNRESHPLTLPA